MFQKLMRSVFLLKTAPGVRMITNQYPHYGHLFTVALISLYIPVQVLESGKRVLPSYMFDVTQPPPPEWRVIDDEFVIFIATNVAWISTDFMASPYQHIFNNDIITRVFSP